MLIAQFKEKVIAIAATACYAYRYGRRHYVSVVRLSVRAYVKVEASSHRLFRRLSFVFVLMQYIPFFCVVSCVYCHVFE